MNGVHVLRAARRSRILLSATWGSAPNRRRAGRSLFGLLAMLVLASAKDARADTDPPRAYFYKDRPYGSQTLFNPIYAIVNRGYDAYQLRSDKALLSHASA